MASSSSSSSLADDRGVEATPVADASVAPARPAAAASDAQVVHLDRRHDSEGASDDEDEFLPDDKVPLDSNTAELALRARLKAKALMTSADWDKALEEPNNIEALRLSVASLLSHEKAIADPNPDGRFEFDEATTLMKWALDVSKSGPAGLDKPPTYSRRAVFQLLGVFAATSLTFLFLLLFVRANTTEVATRDGFLLATGIPAYRGEEPIASVAASREFRSLLSVAALPTAALGGLRDVTLVHQGIWRCLHVSSVTKFSDSHVWLEAADGTGVRIRGGKAFLREDHLADEEAIDSSGEAFPSNASAVEPVAYFDVLLKR